MFVIMDLQIYNTERVSMLMTYYRTIFHTPNSSGLLIIVIKPETWKKIL
jgi:hypothetical protein